MRCMPIDPTNPRHPSQWTAAAQAVAELLARVAAERGLDFEPPPAPVIDALPGLTHTVEDVAARCRDEQERRWLAAALAALSHHVQVSTLPEPRPSPDPSNTSNLSGPAGRERGAVVTSPLGLLAGRRRDGIPRWVFPGGPLRRARPRSTPRSASSPRRPGLAVAADHEIGRRTHPATRQRLIYIACTPRVGYDTREVPLDELVEVRWLNPHAGATSSGPTCPTRYANTSTVSSPWCPQ